MGGGWLGVDCGNDSFLGLGVTVVTEKRHDSASSLQLLSVPLVLNTHEGGKCLGVFCGMKVVLTLLPSGHGRVPQRPCHMSLASKQRLAERSPPPACSRAGSPTNAKQASCLDARIDLIGSFVRCPTPTRDLAL